MTRYRHDGSSEVMGPVETPLARLVSWAVMMAVFVGLAWYAFRS